MEILRAPPARIGSNATRRSCWSFPNRIQIASETTHAPTRRQELPVPRRPEILTAVLAEPDGPVSTPWPLPDGVAPLWAARDDDEDEAAGEEEEDEEEDDEEDDFDDL